MGAPSGQRSGDGGGETSASLFELPVSKGARLVRMAMILGLNLLLVAGGIALSLEYLHKRDKAKQGPSTAAKTVDDNVGPVDTAPEAGLGQGSDAQRQGAPKSDAGVGTSATSGHDSSAKDGVTTGTHPASGGSDAGPSTTGPRQGNTGGTGEKPPLRGLPDAGAFRSRVADAGQLGEAPTPEEEANRVRVLAAQISLVVGSHQGQLTRCYESASKVTTPDKPIEGRIEVRFTVQGDGSATGVASTKNTTESASLENCLLALVRSWTFPTSGGEALDFVWPFDFQAPK